MRVGQRWSTRRVSNDHGLCDCLNRVFPPRQMRRSGWIVQGLVWAYRLDNDRRRTVDHCPVGMPATHIFQFLRFDRMKPVGPNRRGRLRQRDVRGIVVQIRLMLKQRVRKIGRSFRASAPGGERNRCIPPVQSAARAIRRTNRRRWAFH